MPTTARKQSTVKLDKRELTLSNLDKVLYKETGFTKGDVVDYYLRVSSTILPHLKGRPLTLKRFPNGTDGMFFYEKRCPAHKPDWIQTIKFFSESNDGYIFFCTLDEPAALA